MAASAVKGLMTAGKYAGASFRDLLKYATPGALFSGGISTIFTGNPLIGAMVGGTDLLASAGAARLIGKMNPKWAGGPAGAFKIDPITNQMIGKPSVGFSPSTPQHIAMGATSIATPIALEPMLLGNQAQYYDPRNTSQQSLDTQLQQRESVNNLQSNQNLANNTMFQDLLYQRKNPESARQALTQNMFARYGL